MERRHKLLGAQEIDLLAKLIKLWVISHEAETSLLLFFSSIDYDSTSEWPFLSELQWLRRKRRRRAVSVISNTIFKYVYSLHVCSWHKRKESEAKIILHWICSCTQIDDLLFPTSKDSRDPVYSL